MKASVAPSPEGASTPPAPAIPPTAEYPIDLSAALRLADAENPLIAEARQRVAEALAIQQGARALLLPTFNAGTNYRGHSGNLQRSSGRILNVSSQSLYLGGGARTLAAESVAIPAVNIFSSLTDALFEPLAARQQVALARFGASAAANRILLEVAELHFELVAAEAVLEARKKSFGQGAELARLTRDYAEAGEGRSADAERAATALSLIEGEIRAAEEQSAVNAARLSRRLHLDPAVRLRPVSSRVGPITLIDPDSPLPGLIESALRARPELGARAAAVATAEARHGQERWRPFLPTLWVGFSGGAFGGGSNLVPPLVANFGGRTDFDARIFWTVQNLGLGNRSLQKRRWAEVGQAVGEQSRMSAEIRAEVSAAHAEAAAARRQIGLTTRQLQSAETGLEEDLVRIRNTIGRPVEVVNSLELLDKARYDHIRAVIDFNKAEFRLFVALGSPPPLDGSPSAPIPAPPLAAPPLPPLITNRH